MQNMQNAAQKILQGFDPKTQKVNSFTPIPAGEYTVMITSASPNNTQNGGIFLQVNAEIQAGDLAGAKEHMRLFMNPTFTDKNGNTHDNPGFARNVKLLARMASAGGMNVATLDFSDVVPLAESLQPLVGKMMKLTIELSENKKNPKFPYRNYDADPISQSQPAQQHQSATTQNTNPFDQPTTQPVNNNDLPFD